MSRITNAQSAVGHKIIKGIVQVIAPMHQMNRKEIIKLVLQMSFLIMALRQYLLLGDWFGCLFLSLILLSLVISEN